jgi:hypothetical protein
MSTNSESNINDDVSVSPSAPSTSSGAAAAAAALIASLEQQQQQQLPTLSTQSAQTQAQEPAQTQVQEPAQTQSQETAEAQTQEPAEAQEPAQAQTQAPHAPPSNCNYLDVLSNECQRFLLANTIYTVGDFLAYSGASLGPKYLEYKRQQDAYTVTKRASEVGRTYVYKWQRKLKGTLRNLEKQAIKMKCKANNEKEGDCHNANDHDNVDGRYNCHTDIDIFSKYKDYTIASQEELEHAYERKRLSSLAGGRQSSSSSPANNTRKKKKQKRSRRKSSRNSPQSAQTSTILPKATFITTIALPHKGSLGIEVSEANEQENTYTYISGGNSNASASSSFVSISNVAPDGQGEKAGLRAQDVIVSATVSHQHHAVSKAETDQISALEMLYSNNRNDNDNTIEKNSNSNHNANNNNATTHDNNNTKLMSFKDFMKVATCGVRPLLLTVKRHERQGDGSGGSRRKRKRARRSISSGNSDHDDDSDSSEDDDEEEEEEDGTNSDNDEEENDHCNGNGHVRTSTSSSRGRGRPRLPLCLEEDSEIKLKRLRNLREGVLEAHELRTGADALEKVLLGVGVVGGSGEVTTEAAAPAEQIIPQVGADGAAPCSVNAAAALVINGVRNHTMATHQLQNTIQGMRERAAELWNCDGNSHCESQSPNNNEGDCCFEECFKLLLEYRQQHGHSDQALLRKDTSLPPKLRKFVTKQRNAFFTARQRGFKKESRQKEHELDVEFLSKIGYVLFRKNGAVLHTRHCTLYAVQYYISLANRVFIHGLWARLV